MSSHPPAWVCQASKINQGGRREGASREVVRKVDGNISWEGRMGMEGDTVKRKS